MRTPSVSHFFCHFIFLCTVKGFNTPVAEGLLKRVPGFLSQECGCKTELVGCERFISVNVSDLQSKLDVVLSPAAYTKQYGANKSKIE